MTPSNGGRPNAERPDLGFGLFLSPFHTTPGQNPLLTTQRDLETIQFADRAGFDEVWIGEHHSGGSEIIPSPEIFIAWAAAQTKRITLGAGAITLPLHNPLWVADRALYLDNLTRGRFKLACGPGVLPLDARMVGLDLTRTREALQEDVPILLRLLRGEGPVTVETERYKLVDAQSQWRPYSDPLFEVAVTAGFTPGGYLTAARNGTSMLSFGGISPTGVEGLRGRWDAVQRTADAAGQAVDRRNWRIGGPVHIAETREQAIEDLRYGLKHFVEYFGTTAGDALAADAGETFDEQLEWLVSTMGLVGTPDDVIERIDSALEATGGFGTFLVWLQQLASPAASLHSLELLAEHVIPRYRRSLRSWDAGREWVRDHHEIVQGQMAAQSREFVERLKRRDPEAAAFSDLIATND